MEPEICKNHSACLFYVCCAGTRLGLRCVIFLFTCPDHSGARNHLGHLQYMFEGPEIQVQIKPHGNAKGSSPYFWTSDSTKEQMQTIAAMHLPKAAVTALTEQQGGEMEVRRLSCLPRNRQQISNIRWSKFPKDTNVLYCVMLECKTAQGKHSGSVRDVKVAPSPQAVLLLTGRCKLSWGFIPAIGNS